MFIQQYYTKIKNKSFERVDSVIVDPAFDGPVFRIALADVPERKDNLVIGSYRLESAQYLNNN